LWRFRAGYRWDANDEAYIFPALALKKVDGPMAEYQKGLGRRLLLKAQEPTSDDRHHLK
jgi:hypothetical protein